MRFLKNPYKSPRLPQDFVLPTGGIGNMDDIVTVRQAGRYEMEVMLIQRALGVRDDGIIGPETRNAVAQLGTPCL
jgi:hypothetical protein